MTNQAVLYSSQQCSSALGSAVPQLADLYCNQQCSTALGSAVLYFKL